jgi:hypothetical protein
LDFDWLAVFVFLDSKAVAGRFLTPTFDPLVAATYSGLIYFVETFLAGLLYFAFALDFNVAVDWRLPTLTLSLLYEGFVPVTFFIFPLFGKFGASFCASAA